MFGKRGLMLISCLLATATISAAGNATGSAFAPAPEAQEGEVDLYLLSGGAEFVPGGAADRGMTVINHGRDMSGDLELFYTTPIFINIDAGKPLPNGCVMYHKNKDYRIPEIVKCTLPPLKHGARADVSFPITVYPDAPAVPTYGSAITRPADSAKDAERNITDNIARPGGVISLEPWTAPVVASRAEIPNIVTQSTTAILQNNKSTNHAYTVSNTGDVDAKNTHLLVVNAMYINTSTAGGLPPGCTMVLADRDPAVPEIVDCALGDIPAGQKKDLAIPVEAVPGGPIGQCYSNTVATTDSTAPGLRRSNSAEGGSAGMVVVGMFG